MCKASLHAKETRKAVAGEVLAVGTNYLGMGAFHPQGVAIAQCLVCVEMGAELTLANIPQKARDLYGLNDTEEVLFYETEGSHNYIVHDLVMFRDRPDLGALPLAHFAGPKVRATMKLVDAAEDAVEALKRLAIAPKLVSQTPTIDDLHDRHIASLVE